VLTRVLAVLALLALTSGLVAPGAAQAQITPHPGAYAGEAEGVHLSFTLSADGDRMLAIFFHHRLHGGAVLEPGGILPVTCVNDVCLQGRWVDTTVFVGSYHSPRHPERSWPIHAAWHHPDDLAEGRYAPVAGSRVAVSFELRHGRLRDLVASGVGYRIAFPDTDLVSHHFEACHSGACLSGHWRGREIVGHLRSGAGTFTWAAVPRH
jgi:hypothetical protein